ncbi:PREDICTED: MAP7 domain-containing protein 1-like [Nicotiana attenuata]|uniref:MAP7 domain-containing protein 1-like n=1 Tax=Nicotiana attenuata TaxID=49451 RepID=UPI000904CBD2|nr:PREDICTED: MAP7 domain-containing protein 1-like [Nicotiana attenuata]
MITSSSDVTGDIGFKPTSGLKWKGKQAITIRRLQEIKDQSRCVIAKAKTWSQVQSRKSWEVSQVRRNYRICGEGLCRCGLWEARLRSAKADDFSQKRTRRYGRLAAGFAIRGVTSEVAIALRVSSGTPLSLERTQATLPKRKIVEEDSEDDEDEDTSLMARPRARRRIISEDEAEISSAHASSLIEPVTVVSDDETIPRDTIESTQRLFVDGFESGELGPVLDEVPLSSSIPIPFIPPLVSSASLPILSVPTPLPISAPLPVSTPSTPVIFTSSTVPPSIAPPSSVQHAEEGSSSRSLAMRSVTLEANLIGTELMGRIFLLEKKSRESDKTVLEAERVAKEAQLEQKWTLTSELAGAKASSSKAEKDKERLECSFSEQLSKSSEEIRELKALLAKKEEYAGELVQNLTQVQADLNISSDKVRALESSHASLEASLDSSLAENQVLKNDLAMWEKEYELLEENFNIESELAKVLKTIEMTQQPLDFPSPANEAPVAEEPLNEEAVAAFVEAETSVTLAPLDELSTSIPAGTAPVAASSEVTTVPIAVHESEANITTSGIPAPQ